jgi:D-alanine-D-alanine ligase-like ATP-grasp enzyme
LTIKLIIRGDEFIQIGVIIGGYSTEREISLMAGNEIIKNLVKENTKYFLFL